jgi:hypothetical protein
MELVKLVMEIYYNLIRLQELEDNNFADNNNKSENNFNPKDNNNSNNKNGTNSRSPQSVYYANHSHNHNNNNIEQQQATTRVHNAHQHNDNIYMNNSGLNSSITEMKQNITQQHQQQQKQQKPAPTNNSKLIASTIQNMESFNLNDNETVSNDYINRLIDEINKNSNRRGFFLIFIKKN